MLPEARRAGLITEELPEEILVYDLRRHRSYCLNRTAALVWRHCDGQTPVAELARLLQNELQVPASEEVVWLALRQLSTADLLRKGMTWPLEVPRYSRREVARRFALLGGLSVLVPAVASIVAPTAAQAASCVQNCDGKPNCTPCQGDNQGGSNTCKQVCKNGGCINKPGSGCR